MEAKIHAFMQSMALTMQHTKLSVTVQSDSSVAISIFNDESFIRPPYSYLALEIKSLRENREFIQQKFHHSQNRVEGYLARYRRTNRTIECGYTEGPHIPMNSCLVTVKL